VSSECSVVSAHSAHSAHAIAQEEKKKALIYILALKRLRAKSKTHKLYKFLDRM